MNVCFCSCELFVSAIQDSVYTDNLYRKSTGLIAQSASTWLELKLRMIPLYL